MTNLDLIPPSMSRKIINAAYRIESLKRHLAEAEREYAMLWKQARAAELHLPSAEAGHEKAEEPVVAPVAHS